MYNKNQRGLQLHCEVQNLGSFWKFKRKVCCMWGNWGTTAVSFSWDVATKGPANIEMAPVPKVLRRADSRSLCLWGETTFLIGGGHFCASDCSKIMPNKWWSSNCMLYVNDTSTAIFSHRWGMLIRPPPPPPFFLPCCRTLLLKKREHPMYHWCQKIVVYCDVICYCRWKETHAAYNTVTWWL
jgi:hypothetical protein